MTSTSIRPEPGPTAAPVRHVLVAEPYRLTREALMAAVDGDPALAALDGATNDRSVAARADAAVVAASLLRVGWHRLFADGRWIDGPSPIVILADHGPVTPSIDANGIAVVSRQTPLEAVIACLRADGPTGGAPSRWEGTVHAPEPALTMRERQVLGLLASGLSPTEVARGLAITTHTARDHIKAIRTKLDRPTIMAAVLEAIRRGMLHMDCW
jgi:DNA-binding CsgD family transcriptional regulator